MKIRIGAAIVSAVLALAAGGFAQSSSAGQAPSAGQQDRSGPPSAADAPSPAGAIASQLAQLLNLDNGQTIKVRNVLEDERSQMIALRDDQTMSLENKQAKLLVIRKKASNDIMAILTPEQQKKLVDALEGPQQEGQPGVHQAPAPPHR